MFWGRMMAGRSRAVLNSIVACYVCFCVGCGSSSQRLDRSFAAVKDLYADAGTPLNVNTYEVAQKLGPLLSDGGIIYLNQKLGSTNQDEHDVALCVLMLIHDMMNTAVPHTEETTDLRALILKMGLRERLEQGAVKNPKEDMRELCKLTLANCFVTSSTNAPTTQNND